MCLLCLHYAQAAEYGSLVAFCNPLGGLSEARLAGCILMKGDDDSALSYAGSMTKKEIEETYAISRRIEAEERALETATMVLTSTQQEIDEQWGLYDG